MTPAERLRAAADALEALAKGKPGYGGDPVWCPTWTHTAVRNVQRNLDIECPKHCDDEEDGAEECGQWGRYDGALIALLRSLVAPLVADLRESAAFFDDFGQCPPSILAVADAILGDAS